MLRCKITAIKDEYGWLELEKPLRDFEAFCQPGCYMNWNYQFSVWKALYRGKTVRLIEFFDAGLLIGVAFLVEDLQTRKGLTFHVLRSMDFAVMHMPPMMMRRGFEQAALKAFAVSRLKIAHKCGADLVALYKIEDSPGKILLDMLKATGLPGRSHVFNTNYQVEIYDGVEAYIQSKTRKTVYNIRRAARQLSELMGVEPKLLRLRGDVFGQDDFRDKWRLFQAIRSRSWQMEDAGERGSGYSEMIERFFDDVLIDWSRRGWLDLALLMADERVLAGQINAVIGDEQWVILMAFDQDLKNFSPGRVLFYYQLQDAWERGDRRIIMGGASETGKSIWSNREDDTLTIEIPLYSIKGILWALSDAPKKIKGIIKQYLRRRGAEK